MVCSMNLIGLKIFWAYPLLQEPKRVADLPDLMPMSFLARRQRGFMFLVGVELAILRLLAKQMC